MLLLTLFDKYENETTWKFPPISILIFLMLTPPTLVSGLVTPDQRVAPVMSPTPTWAGRKDGRSGVYLESVPL